MPWSHFQRAWRPLALITSGIVIGAGLVAPVAARVGGVAPTIVQTRAASCPAYAFHVIDSFTGYGYEDALVFSRGGGTGFFVCDPGLPNGAVVTKVQFTLEDLTDQGEARFCGLDRVDLRQASAGQYVGLASVPATGVAAAPGTRRLTDDSIAHATVDTTRYGYWLQCQLTTPIRYLGIYGATVTYQISAANG